jgi:hypothetical protein
MENLMFAIMAEVVFDALNGYYEPVMGPNSISRVDAVRDKNWLGQMAHNVDEYILGNKRD